MWGGGVCVEEDGMMALACCSATSKQMTISPSRRSSPVLNATTESTRESV